MARLDQALEALLALDDLAAGARARGQPDPRALLLAALACIGTTVSFERHTVSALLPLALFPTVLAIRAQLPWHMLRRALLLAAPFVLMVGLFNPLFERQTVLWLAGWPISGGWLSLLSILLRAALTISTALVLVVSTGMPALCNALTRLQVAQPLILQLWLLYRYLFVLGAEAARMDTARRLRAGASARASLATWAALLGQLLLRSVDRAQRLHQAMLARGFAGQLPCAPLQWRAADTVWVVGWCLYFAAVRAMDLPLLLGTWLLRGQP
jgi:cobalt/nickel transport system permease protein